MNTRKRSATPKVKVALLRAYIAIRRTLRKSAALLFTRQAAAYFFMLLFVSCTSIGAFTIYAPAGWITIGVTSGILGYLLGSE